MPKSFSGGKASLVQARGLGIRKASQSQRCSQDLAAAPAAGQLCPLRIRHAVRRSPVRRFGMWRLMALPIRDQLNNNCGSPRQTSDFSHSTGISRLNITRMSLNNHQDLSHSSSCHLPCGCAAWLAEAHFHAAHSWRRLSENIR